MDPINTTGVPPQVQPIQETNVTVAQSAVTPPESKLPFSQVVNVVISSIVITLVFSNLIRAFLSSFINMLGIKQDSTAFIFLSVLLYGVVFSIIVWVMTLGAKRKWRESEARGHGVTFETEEDKAKAALRAKDMLTVRWCYWINVFAAILLTGVSTMVKNFSPIPVYLVIYGVSALLLLGMAIANIRAGRRYEMLGQFFVFLMLPVFLGFGMCMFAIVAYPLLSQIFR